MHIILYIYITCVYAWIFIGYKFVSRADFGVISVHSLFHFKIKMTIQKKTMTTSFHSVMWSPPYKTALFLGISGKIYTFFSAKESFWSAPWGDHGDMSFTRNPLDQGRSFFCKRRILCVPSIQKKQNIWPIYHLLITYIIYDYIYIYIYHPWIIKAGP